MTEIKRGDRVRVKGNAAQTALRGEEFTVTSVTSTLGSRTPYVMGDSKGHGVWLKDVELVLDEIDTSAANRPSLAIRNLNVSRNWAESHFGTKSELDSAVYVNTCGDTTLSLDEAKKLRDVLTDIIERVERDQAIRKAKEEKANGNAEKKATILAKIEELRKEAERL